MRAERHAPCAPAESEDQPCGELVAEQPLNVKRVPALAGTNQVRTCLREEPRGRDRLSDSSRCPPRPRHTRAPLDAVIELLGVGRSVQHDLDAGRDKRLRDADGVVEDSASSTDFDKVNDTHIGVVVRSCHTDRTIAIRTRAPRVPRARHRIGDHGDVNNGPTSDPAALHAQDEQTAANAQEAGLVPLHAAAVESFGQIVAIAGQSGAGKSTLAAAAVLTGDLFVSDEITAVSPIDRIVRPYHRPIGIRQGGADALGLDFPDSRRSIPGAVHPFPVEGEDQLSAGGVLDAIVIVRWEPRVASLEPVEPAQALAELAQHIVVSDDGVEAAFRGLDQIVRAVKLFRLTYGVPSIGVEMLHEVVNS